MAGCQRLRCRQLQGSHLHHLPKAGFRAWLHAMESQERQLIRKTTTKGTIFTSHSYISSRPKRSCFEWIRIVSCSPKCIQKLYLVFCKNVKMIADLEGITIAQFLFNFVSSICARTNHIGQLKRGSEYKCQRITQPQIF